jgi:hypothetical protein
VLQTGLSLRFGLWPGWLSAKRGSGLSRWPEERPDGLDGDLRREEPGFDQWLLSSHVYSADGQRLGNGFIVCGPLSAADQSRGCAGYQPGDFNLNKFHPGSEYWTFQLIETGIFVVAAALLLLLAFRCLLRMA